MDRDKMNGSVDLVADAMLNVFTEGVQGAVDPLTDRVKAVRTEVRDLTAKSQSVEGATDHRVNS